VTYVSGSDSGANGFHRGMATGKHAQCMVKMIEVSVLLRRIEALEQGDVIES